MKSTVILLALLSLAACAASPRPSMEQTLAPGPSESSEAPPVARDTHSHAADKRDAQHAIDRAKEGLKQFNEDKREPVTAPEEK